MRAQLLVCMKIVTIESTSTTKATCNLTDQDSMVKSCQLTSETIELYAYSIN